jgi:uncharacterized protein (UPF0332 family)
LPKRKHDQARLDIAKATKAGLAQYKRGIYIEKATGHKIDDLTLQACKARLALAKRFLDYASGAMKLHPNASRLAIGRSYYAMYHAARAVVFFHFGGDDHQEHATLPAHLPPDFPQVAIWQNALRLARLERNRVDYDPYPKSEKAYAATAQTTFGDCAAFLRESRKYLIKKGVKL